jgi:hypothetical protein
LAAVSEIVNLRRARKQKARAGKEEKAAENRARFGTPKAVRELTKARSEQEKRELGAHRLGPDKPLEE